MSTVAEMTFVKYYPAMGMITRTLIAYSLVPMFCGILNELS
jgi:hypothetical protein